MRIFFKIYWQYSKNRLQYSYRRFVSGCKQTRRKEVMDKMTDKERQDTKMAMLYELRLIFANGEKKEYTTEEIVELLDKIAMAKEQ